MSLEFISGLVVVLLGLIAGAFGLGHARGTSKAEAKAEQQHRRERLLPSPRQNAGLMQRKGPAMYRREAYADDDVDRELREKFTRPGSR
jgi:hypothetical protein